jgi:hypothetical protein
MADNTNVHCEAMSSTWTPLWLPVGVNLRMDGLRERCYLQKTLTKQTGDEASKQEEAEREDAVEIRNAAMHALNALQCEQ